MRGQKCCPSTESLATVAQRRKEGMTAQNEGEQPHANPDSNMCKSKDSYTQELGILISMQLKRSTKIVQELRFNDNNERKL